MEVYDTTPYDAALASVTQEIKALREPYLILCEVNETLREELRFYQDKMAQLAYENISLKNELAEAKVKAEGTHNTRVSDERRREIEQETIFQLKLKAERLDQIEKLFASFSADPRKGAK